MIDDRAPGARSRPRITRAMRRDVAARDGLLGDGTAPASCAYCDGALRWVRENGRVQLLDGDGGPTPELDHVVPLAVGGPHIADNLVPACLMCNRAKGTFDRTPKRAPKQTLELLHEQRLKRQSSDAGMPRPVPSRPVLTPGPPAPARSTDLVWTFCSWLRQSSCRERARKAENVRRGLGVA